MLTQAELLAPLTASFIIVMLNIPFEGDINSRQECSHFLSEYLEQAKQMYTELKCEYETDRGY